MKSSRKFFDLATAVCLFDGVASLEDVSRH